MRVSPVALGQLLTCAAVVSLIFATIAGSLAARRGRSPFGGCLLGVLLGPIGLVLIRLLPVDAIPQTTPAPLPLPPLQPQAEPRPIVPALPLYQPVRPDYRLRDDFLSRAEASFMRVLQQALGEAYLLCPKVNLGDLFYAPHDQAAWNRINRKHVDFLVCDPDTLRPLLGIELDDRSHQRPDRQARDDLVNEVFDIAGLPLLRMPVRSRYVLAEVEVEVGAVLSQATDFVPAPKPSVHDGSLFTPACPKCGTTMVMRTSKRGAKAGEQFYGCPNYPRCHGMVFL